MAIIFTADLIRTIRWWLPLITKASKQLACTSSTRIPLPSSPHDPYNPKSTFMTAEKMLASKTPENRTAFSFSIEVGEKMRREKFEWRQIGKGEDSKAEVGGFKLVRVSPRHWDNGKSNSGSNSEERPSSPTKATKDKSETVAILAWTKGWFGHANVFSTHPFTLRLVYSWMLGQLGDRRAVKTVLTALRIDDLLKIGRTNHRSIHIGEKIRGGNSPGKSQGKVFESKE